MIYKPGQEKIIQRAVSHIKKGNNQVYQFAGEAGTGKTTVLMEIIRRIGIPLDEIAIMTYIGQAAIVLRSKGLYPAKTIHSSLYRFVEQEIVDEFGFPIMDEVYNKPIVRLVFEPAPLENKKYIIIDEGYTVPLSMKKEIESRGLKIIVCGDTHQLPPVGDDPAYLVDGHIDYLTEYMRQNEGSAILYIADLVKRGITPSTGLYGDVLVVEQKDVTDEMIKASNIMVCGTNNTRDYLNDRTRKSILNFHTKMPMCGEKLICRKNYWAEEIDGISLANGLIGQVITPPNVLDVNRNDFIIDFKPDMMSSYFSKVICDYEYFVAPAKDKQFLKNSKYSSGKKMEFAYAITTHLSQGAQYPNGMYFSEYLNKDIQNNLNYTGVTRFSRSMIYVVPTIRKYTQLYIPS